MAFDTLAQKASERVHDSSIYKLLRKKKNTVDDRFAMVEFSIDEMISNYAPSDPMYKPMRKPTTIGGIPTSYIWKSPHKVNIVNDVSPVADAPCYADIGRFLDPLFPVDDENDWDVLDSDATDVSNENDITEPLSPATLANSSTCYKDSYDFDEDFDISLKRKSISSPIKHIWKHPRNVDVGDKVVSDTDDYCFDADVMRSLDPLFPKDDENDWDIIDRNIFDPVREKVIGGKSIDSSTSPKFSYTTQRRVRIQHMPRKSKYQRPSRPPSLETIQEEDTRGPHTTPPPWQGIVKKQVSVCENLKFAANSPTRPLIIRKKKMDTKPIQDSPPSITECSFHLPPPPPCFAGCPFHPSPAIELDMPFNHLIDDFTNALLDADYNADDNFANDVGECNLVDDILRDLLRQK
ncbi:hypothetical protein BDQ17DRAFT_1434690 [Cyathus striatus]|nr:hypothetical protein BDQ17DRAFT_1434690 [Cyathus striatus]